MLPEQAAQQTVSLSVIWAMMAIWHNYNDNTTEDNIDILLEWNHLNFNRI